MNAPNSADVDDDFFPRLRALAQELGARAEDMLAVMYSESGCRAAAHNPNGDASGLIQFMPDTLRRLGWTGGHAAFRRLGATEQLAYVCTYYLPYRGHLRSIAALYTATFLPAFVLRAGDPDFVLTAKGGPLGWAYGPNAVFDTNHDLAITVGELEAAVRRNARGARYDELRARLAGDPVDELDPPTHDGGELGPDLRTTRGIQQALAQLGHDPGTIDGIPGPRTHAAVAAFQAERNLTPDGVVGPLTREALELALRAAA